MHELNLKVNDNQVMDVNWVDDNLDMDKNQVNYDNHQMDNDNHQIDDD